MAKQCPRQNRISEHRGCGTRAILPGLPWLVATPLAYGPAIFRCETRKIWLGMTERQLGSDAEGGPLGSGPRDFLPVKQRNRGLDCHAEALKDADIVTRTFFSLRSCLQLFASWLLPWLALVSQLLRSAFLPLRHRLYPSLECMFNVANFPRELQCIIIKEGEEIIIIQIIIHFNSIFVGF